ncbi:MAG: MBL fold metallo-hydrolase [Smithellaceae bacterium]|nr:MBL fold metallo-hydrolase [Smithellaceae bacterium]
MSLRMRWLGTACFEIVLPNGRTIITDPFVDEALKAPLSSDGFEGCDYLFLTHGHYDHILDTGKIARRFQPKIYCNNTTAQSLINYQDIDPALIIRIKPGDVIREKGLGIEVLGGIHMDFATEYKRLTGKDIFAGAVDLMSIVRRASRIFLESDELPDNFEERAIKYQPGEQLNFVFDPTGGKRIFMTETQPDESIIERARQARAFITLLQIPVANILKGLEEKMAELVSASGCSIVVPHHHDALIPGAKETDLAPLRDIVERTGRTVFQELERGRWYDFA